ncbi:MAG: PLP-dependent aminotransferase family protein [Thermoflexales bacterium]|nr:PLP-dependent aminotransferase family protein [Thermoflexales bacterium]
MAKHAPDLALLAAPLDPDASTPLYRQLYDAIRKAILIGRFAPGARLPSTRALADELSLSRNTVALAFDQLFAEGYLEGRIGSGTYVSRALPDELLHAEPATHAGPTNEPAILPSAPATPSRALSQRGRETSELRVYSPYDLSHGIRPFVTGVPAVDAFPMETWTRVAGKAWHKLTAHDLSYGDPAGFWPLRKAIAERLREARAVRCDPEQVIVVGGTQQAIDVIAHTLINPGDTVCIEDPVYLGASAGLTKAGARLAPIPIDSEGLRVADARVLDTLPRLVFVAPSYQYPTGVTMSLARRLALLDWARRTGVWVIEDDYDCEFRYSGRPLASLQSLDEDRRVIYVGTFSKSLLPALRLGFVVAPPDLVDAFRSARAVSDRHVNTLEQAALADFIQEGHFDQHLRRMRTLYLERQEALLDIAQHLWAGLIEMQPGHAGLHVVGRLEPGCDAQHIARQAAAQGVTVIPLSAFASRPLSRDGLALGYAAYTPRDLRKAAARLTPILERAHLATD